MAYIDKIEALLSTYGEQVKTAFLAAIDDITSGVTIAVIAGRLERGDIAGAVEAIGLDPRAFEGLERAIEAAYTGGGEAEVGKLPIFKEPSGARVVIRFGVRNLPAERELREHSAALVTRIVADQRVAIQAALSDGLAAGRNPRSTALDVIGRVDRSTNRRTGGIIGLTAPQERYVANARAELLSGKPEDLANYLTRERRDKRFDRTVSKAISDGKPLPAEIVAKIVGRYSDKLLDLRGEMLARTETMTALSKGRDDAIRQQIDSGRVAERDVTKTWHSAGGGRVRHTHRILNGQKVPMNGVFISPSGAVLRHPGDPLAPVEEIAGCRCFMSYRIAYIDALVRKQGGQ